MRKAVLWVSPHATQGSVEMIDMRQLPDPWPMRLLMVQGLDTFPPDAVLVVVHNADLPKIRGMCLSLLGTVADNYVARRIVERMIEMKPELREVLGW